MSKILLSNTLLFILPLLCIFQQYYGITYGPVDIIFLIILIILLKKFFSHKLEFDKLSILLFLIILFALLTMLVFKITQTSWINVFRSNLFTFLIYTYIINFRKFIDKTIFIKPFFLINIFNIWILMTTWSSGFTHHLTDMSYFNLNNIGFISFIILIISITLEVNSSNKNNHINAINIFISITLVLLSFSRSNYLLLGMLTIYIMLFILNSKNNLKLIALSLVIIFLLVFQSVGSDIFTYGFIFFDSKVNAGSPSEIFLGRFNDIMITPINNYLAEKHFLMLLLGGSLLPEHSLLITHLTCFGIVSMCLYLAVSIHTIKTIRCKPQSIKIASLLMFFLLINDLSTNASTYVAFVKLIPFAFYGLIIGDRNAKQTMVRW